MILVISAAQSLQARVPVTLDLEDLPGLGPQPVLQPGPVGADSAGVEKLLEDSVWPGLVQLHSGCEMIEISEGGEVLREGTQSVRRVRINLSHLQHCAVAGNVVVRNFKVSDRNVLCARHVEQEEVKLEELVVFE